MIKKFLISKLNELNNHIGKISYVLFKYGKNNINFAKKLKLSNLFIDYLELKINYKLSVEDEEIKNNENEYVKEIFNNETEKIKKLIEYKEKLKNKSFLMNKYKLFNEYKDEISKIEDEANKCLKPTFLQYIKFHRLDYDGLVELRVKVYDGMKLMKEKGLNDEIKRGILASSLIDTKLKFLDSSNYFSKYYGEKGEFNQIFSNILNIKKMKLEFEKNKNNASLLSQLLEYIYMYNLKNGLKLDKLIRILEDRLNEMENELIQDLMMQ